MTTVNVQGVGDIELPDGLSQQEMEEAINSHPDVQKYVAQQNPTTLYGKVDKYLANTFGPINKSIKDNNFLGMQTSQNIGHQAVKGIPILGALAPDTDESKQFEADHPTLSTAANIAGGVAATAPISALAEGAAALKPAYSLGAEYAPKAFDAVESTISPVLRYLRSGTAQAGVGAGLNAADTAARGGSLADIKNKAELGAIGGAASPVLSKVLSPGLNLSDKMAKFIAAAGGAAGGHSLFGNDGILGLLLGEAPLASEGIKKIAANNVLQNPGSKAVLNALLNKASQNAPTSLLQVPNGD